MKYDKMKKIQTQMEDELDGAYKYIKCAIEYKETDRSWADLYFSMSQQEYQHMQSLHNLATSEIQRLASTGDTSYETMKSVYDYLHERLMDKAAEVQAMMTMYKS